MCIISATNNQSVLWIYVDKRTVTLCLLLTFPWFIIALIMRKSQKMNQKNMIFLFIIIIKFIIGILIENSKGYNLNVLEEAGSCRVYNHSNSNNNDNNNTQCCSPHSLKATKVKLIRKWKPAVMGTHITGTLNAFFSHLHLVRQ